MLFLKNKFYLFIFGCAGASLLCQLFSHCSKRGILSGCGSRASHCRAWALGQVASAAAKSLQSCPTLCDPMDSSPPGAAIPGILQAGALKWVAISFSNAWKWSHSVMSDSSQPHGLQPTRLHRPWNFPGKSTGVSCHCLLQLGQHRSVVIEIRKLSTSEIKYV